MCFWRVRGISVSRCGALASVNSAYTRQTTKQRARKAHVISVRTPIISTKHRLRTDARDCSGSPKIFWGRQDYDRPELCCGRPVRPRSTTTNLFPRPQSRSDITSGPENIDSEPDREFNIYWEGLLAVAARNLQREASAGKKEWSSWAICSLSM